MELFAQEFAFLGYVSKPGVTNLTEAQNYCNNTLLKESLFATSRYCHMNFNDIINAIVVLSALLVGNNWQDILFNAYFNPSISSEAFYPADVLFG